MRDQIDMDGATLARVRRHREQIANLEDRVAGNAGAYSLALTAGAGFAAVEPPGVGFRGSCVVSRQGTLAAVTVGVTRTSAATVTSGGKVVLARSNNPSQITTGKLAPAVTVALLGYKLSPADGTATAIAGKLALTAGDLFVLLDGAAPAANWELSLSGVYLANVDG